MLLLENLNFKVDSLQKWKCSFARFSSENLNVGYTNTLYTVLV